MKFEFAEQYKCVCVVIEPGDTAEAVIQAAFDTDAVYLEEGEYCPCVRFPDRPQEIYTVEALRRSGFPGVGAGAG